MTESSIPVPDDQPVEALTPKPSLPQEQQKLYHVSFREGQQPKAALAKVLDLAKGETVMVQTDHGHEPALIGGSGIVLPSGDLSKPLEVLTILRRASADEIGKYKNLMQREQDARRYCQGRIRDLGLEMKLLQVERYCNGSKVIFYFSAETRVDFRDLVKSLVQEFRTRVEMRQIGVRHETQMLGGIGCCGRELCCGLFMKDFVPVSIKMAKEQDLPLNPAKISGVCNRLLCCLTHEYETYKALKKGMPKVGRVITFEDKSYKVNYCKTLSGTVSITGVDDPTDSRVLTREEWESGVSAPKVRPEVEERPVPSRLGNTSAGSARQGAGGRSPSPKPATGRGGPASRQTAPGGQSAPAKQPAPSRPPVPARQPALPRQPGPQQPPEARPAAVKPQNGRPGPGKVEDGKPAGDRPPRSRRSRGTKKGKTP
jgi:cell fate regulator YaaT (PSP1 superfamily)